MGGGGGGGKFKSRMLLPYDDCHNVRQHNSVCFAMWIVEGPAVNIFIISNEMNTSKTMTLISNVDTKMIQTRTFGIFSILVRRNRRFRLNGFGRKRFAVVALKFYCIVMPSNRNTFIQLKLIKTKNVNKASACADATVTYL